jgi:hypothetical protein
MKTYVLYKKLSGTDNAYSQESSTIADWHSLAKEYGFRVVRERPTIATVEAEPRNIDLLLRNHPEIEATSEKEYHKA